MSPLIIILVCLILSAFFSGSEIAFATSDKLRMELDRKQGKGSRRILGWFMSHPDYFYATMLTGNMICLVVYGLQVARLLDPLLAPLVTSDLLSLLIQVTVAAIVLLLTSEFLPKTLFRMRPNRVLISLAPVLFLFHVLLFPLTWISVSFSAFLISVMCREKPGEDMQKKVFSRSDLTSLMSETQREPGQEEEVDQEVRLFRNALELKEVRLRECMIPRTEIVSVEVDDHLADLKQLFTETGYSRIVVYEDHIDQILGYVHHSDLFTQPPDIRSIIRPIHIVPESMPASKLLRQLLADHKNAAIVVDEFGGTAGLVTVEDVLEEIFGEIEDEHDRLAWEEVVIKENEYRFSARHEIDYLNEKYHLELPESDDFETLAGLILLHHESIPRTGETVRIGRFEFTILKATTTRIESVRLTVFN